MIMVIQAHASMVSFVTKEAVQSSGQVFQPMVGFASCSSDKLAGGLLAASVGYVCHPKAVEISG